MKRRISIAALLVAVGTCLILSLWSIGLTEGNLPKETPFPPPILTWDGYKTNNGDLIATVLVSNRHQKPVLIHPGIYERALPADLPDAPSWSQFYSFYPHTLITIPAASAMKYSFPVSDMKAETNLSVIWYGTKIQRSVIWRGFAAIKNRLLGSVIEESYHNYGVETVSIPIPADVFSNKAATGNIRIREKRMMF